MAEPDRMQELIVNVLSARQEIFRRLLDPRRDIAAECGHPRDPIDPLIYQELIDRDPIAARVNEVYPRESWRVQPVVYETEQEDCDTDFEASLDEFPKQLSSNGGCDYYEDTEGNALWELCQRADVEVGKGQYGVLFYGLNDSDDLSQPVNLACSNLKVNYIRPLPEYMAQIAQYDSDRRSPRYGMPLSYTINTFDPRESNSGIGVPLQSFSVHYSRVTHIPSDVTTNEVFGAPRLRSVLNRLLDLQKLYGGSAEMYWKGAFPGLSIETQPQLAGDVPVDRAEMRNMMEQYFNGLQRYLALMGFTAKTLAPVVVDPTAQIKVHLEAICIRLGIPMRIFLGSERGELSSAQDTNEWADRIRARQRYYVSYRIIRPLINKLIELKQLCQPKQFRIYWPDIATPSKLERAQYAAAVTQSLSQLANGADSYIAPVDYWTKLLEYTTEEAESIVCAAQGHAEETQQQDMEKEAQMIEKGLKADPTDPEQNPGNPLFQRNGFGGKNKFGKPPQA